MKDKKTFVDSNILLYLFDTNKIRSDFVKELLVKKRYYISTQVVNENINVCIKKFHFPKEKAFQHGRVLIDRFHLCLIDTSIIMKAFEICKTTNYSYWESLILATAIKNDCRVIFTEDLNEGQQIESLEIYNPFR